MLKKEANMPVSTDSKEYILKTIETLPPQKVQAVIDFIDFLRIRSHTEGSAVDDAFLLLQQHSLAKIWDNEEDLYEL